MVVECETWLESLKEALVRLRARGVSEDVNCNFTQVMDIDG
jgi:hypothetical protein